MILFDELTHTYTREDGKELISVTTAIKKYIQPDIYEGVPEAVLERARQRGNDVHKRIDALEKGLPFADNDSFPDMAAYISWREKNPRTVRTEEMVSDDELLAGTIDQVEEVEELTVDLGDVKTTAAVNREYLAWQLSLYAYMYEKMHDCVKVRNLYCIHLKDGKCEKIAIDRINAEAVNALLEAIASGSETFDNPLKKLDKDADALVIKYANLASKIADYEAAMKPIKRDMDAILTRLDEMAKDKESSELVTSIGTFVKSTQTTKKLFNKEQFFAIHQELKDKMEDGMKVSVVENKPKIKWNK